MSSDLRVEGLYKSPPLIDEDDGERYWRYLRFRTDGTVTLVPCTGTEEDVARWVDRDKHLAKGPYRVSGERVEFWVKTEDALLKTRFEGTVTGNMLCVRMWDSNDTLGIREEYTFCPVNVEPPNKGMQPTANQRPSHR